MGNTVNIWQSIVYECGRFTHFQIVCNEIGRYNWECECCGYYTVCNKMEKKKPSSGEEGWRGKGDGGLKGGDANNKETKS